MKVRAYINHILIVILVIVFNNNAIGQDAYKATKANVKITGTSTLHNWEMKGEGITGAAAFDLNQGTVTNVSQVLITIPVINLKSGKGAMDKNAYSALKSDKFKQITYSVPSAKIVGSKIQCTGTLTIAGTPKPFDVEATYIINADQTISCKVVRSFKMTEFKVEPPSFMFGSVTTGDEITITFDILFKKN